MCLNKGTKTAHSPKPRKHSGAHGSAGGNGSPRGHDNQTKEDKPRLCLWLADRPKEEDAAARAVASIAGPSQTRVAYCDDGARSSGNVPSFQLQVGVLSVFGGESPLAESQLAASRAGGFEQKPSPRAPMGWLDHQAKEPRRTRVFCDQRRSRQRNRAFTGRKHHATSCHITLCYPI